MAIRTRVAPMYAGQKILTAILCAVFGVWGAYDYFIKIPRQEAVVTEFLTINERLKSLEGKTLSEQELQAVIADGKRMEELAPGGAPPKGPSKFDRVTQLFFIACLPFAPWFFMMYRKAKRQSYMLDDEGTLHFTGDPEFKTGQWSLNEIADIDMERWMAKSIAYAVHTNGQRLKLDAYLHKELHLIVGAIAHRLYPDKWTPEAKMVKPQQITAEEAASPQEAVDSTAAN